MNALKIRLAGAGEKVQYIVHEFNDNTIRVVLYYPGIVDADVLCATVKAVVESVDILHASFATDSISAYWHVNQEYDESNYFQFVETEANPYITASSLALLPVEPEGKVQLRCCLVQSGSDSAVMLSISHL